MTDCGGRTCKTCEFYGEYNCSSRAKHAPLITKLAEGLAETKETKEEVIKPALPLRFGAV